MKEDADPIAMNERYQERREELKRLRRSVDPGAFDDVARFADGELVRILREHDEQIEGDLIAFVANDFGMPVAFRPERVEKAAQNEIRLEILEAKYKSDARLNTIRKAILNDVKIHKALVSVRSPDEVRYHLPGVSHGETNFVTVREGVGLVDFCTNGDQHNCIEY